MGASLRWYRGVDVGIVRSFLCGVPFIREFVGRSWIDGDGTTVYYVVIGVSQRTRSGKLLERLKEWLEEVFCMVCVRYVERVRLKEILRVLKGEGGFMEFWSSNGVSEIFTQPGSLDKSKWIDFDERQWKKLTGELGTSRKRILVEVLVCVRFGRIEEAYGQLCKMVGALAGLYLRRLGFEEGRVVSVEDSRFIGLKWYVTRALLYPDRGKCN